MPHAYTEDQLCAQPAIELFSARWNPAKMTHDQVEQSGLDQMKPREANAAR